MQKTTTPPSPDPLAFDLKASVEVIGFRFRKAFPEVTKCFAWLIGGIDRGAAWEPLLNSYVQWIGQRRAMSLTREVHDVLGMGLRKNRDLDTLVCDILGWDRALLADEAQTSRVFLTKLHAALQHQQAPSERR
jgi:hypothetical protein